MSPWRCFSLLFGFKCTFQLYDPGLSVYWCGCVYNVALCIGRLRPVTVCGTGFWVCAFLCWVSMGKFNWGFWYAIIFLYVQFWIRPAAVSYLGKKVRTVASPAVRSVNKSRNTRNCVQKEPEYAICVIFTTRLYHKSLGLILCHLIWQIGHNYTRLDDGHCDVGGHRKMSVLGAIGTMVTTHDNFVMMWSFKWPKLFAFCKTYWRLKRVMGFTLWFCL